MSIRIVTHCYAVEYPQYAVFLKVQLSSLINHKTTLPANITVITHSDDTITGNVLDRFYLELRHRLSIMELDKTHLFRRAIGRNYAAKSSEEQIVWFADADYYFGPDCLLDTYEQWRAFEEKPTIIWPHRVLTQRSHEDGEQFWRQHLDGVEPIPQPDFRNFGYHRADRPIGGLQICSGDWVREHGYLGDSNWTNPLPVGTPYLQTICDKKFRHWVQGKGGCWVPIPEIKHLYRFRHQQRTFEKVPKSPKSS